MSDSKNDERAVQAPLKRKYIKPAVITEKLFETMAGCGKADPSQITCQAVQRDGS